MDILDMIAVLILTVFLEMLILVMWEDLETQINNIQPTINEQICEDILPYTFRGRQEFVCYNGDDIQYEPVEIVVIEQWKNR